MSGECASGLDQPVPTRPLSSVYIARFVVVKILYAHMPDPWHDQLDSARRCAAHASEQGRERVVESRFSAWLASLRLPGPPDRKILAPSLANFARFNVSVYHDKRGTFHASISFLPCQIQTALSAFTVVPVPQMLESRRKGTSSSFCGVHMPAIQVHHYIE